MELPTWDRARTKRRGGEPEGGDDAFQGAVRGAGRGVARRGRIIALALVAAVVLAGVAVIVYAQRTTKTAEATQILAAGAAYEARARIGDPLAIFGAPLDHPPFPVFSDEAARDAAVAKAVADLQQVAPGTSPALAAKLVEGAAKLRDGDFAAAEATYRDFIKAAGEAHPLLFLAREGLASAREGRGDVDGALAELRILAGSKGAFYREMALYHQARILADAGRKDEAIAALRSYAEEFPLAEPSLARDAVRALAEGLDPGMLVGTERPPSIQVIDDADGGAP